MRRIGAALSAGVLIGLLVAGCGLFVRNPTPGDNGDTGGGDNGGAGDSGGLITEPPDIGATVSFPPPRTTERPVVTLGPGDTPAPTAPDLGLFLTATASISNTGDDAVGLTVWIRDTANAAWVQVIAETLQTGDAVDQELAPATYSVAFTWNGRPQETCNLEVTDGNTIDFAVLQRHVVITKSDFKPQSGADLDVATSPVCQAPVS